MRGTRRLVIAAGCTGGSKEDEVGVVTSDISGKMRYVKAFFLLLRESTLLLLSSIFTLMHLA